MSDKYKSLGWFIGLWFASVVSISVLAFLIKFVMKWVSLVS